MLRILHLADLHLGWKPQFLGPLAEDRQRERDGLLRRAVDFVLNQHPVDLVIIAGDLFETHKPDSALIESVISDLRRLVAAGVAVVTAPGNHDEITYVDSVYRAYAQRWPGVLIRSPMPAHVDSLDINGTRVHIYGLAYTGGLTQTQPPIDRFPRLNDDGFHVAVFHGSLDWDAGERSLPLRSEALAAARYDYIALGHIHRPSEHKIGPGLAVYPGAIEGKGFNDPGVGVYTVATLHLEAQPDESTAALRGSGTRVQISEFPAEVRPVRSLELDVTPLNDLEETRARIKAATEMAAGHDSGKRTMRDPIVRVRLVGASAGAMDVDALRASLVNDFYFLEVIDETTMLDDETVDMLAREPTVRGEFVRRMRKNMAEASDETQRLLFSRALRRGLAAFEGDAR